ncbi:endochitinase [Dipodascopsis uninucleata]
MISGNHVGTGSDISVGYYASWSQYGRKFTPDMIPPISHVIYAFADYQVKKGIIWTDNNSPDHLKDLVARRDCERNAGRRSYCTLAIGGWNSNAFNNAKQDPQGFAISLASVVAEYRLDGVDLDWEYPNPEDRGLVIAIVSMVRAHIPRPLILSVAMPAPADRMSCFALESIDSYVDYYNLMTYDFAGPWSPKTDHASPMTGAVTAINNLLRCVPPHKIVLGIPLYGRAFSGTDGFGHQYVSASDPGNYGDPGCFDLNDLPRPGVAVQYDRRAGAPFSYDPMNRLFVSHETRDSITQKRNYARSHGLAGLMYWHIAQGASYMQF